MPDSPLTLVILAAGRSRRYGRLKQLDAVGPSGETLLDYSIYDGLRAGFSRFVLVVAPTMVADFRDHLRDPSGAGALIELAVQEGPSPGREKPWGTGHALLSARSVVPGAFGVCNADDFYGRQAMTALAEALSESGGSASQGLGLDACLVPFPLGETLSDRGGVSRGLCRVSPEGRLLELVEGLDLVLNEDGMVRGRDPRGRSVEASTGDPVSMNLWGFGSGIWSDLSEAFDAFLDSDPGPEDEFYVSEFVHRAVTEGRLTCRVLPPGTGWLGVTFPGDRSRVVEALAERTRLGLYPQRLWNARETGRPESRR